MKFDILTIFPEFFESPFSLGIFKKARERNIVELNTHDIRDYTEDKHRTVDDSPYGGGGGMLMKPGPIGRAVEKVRSDEPKSLVILTTPAGELFTDETARELSGYDQLIIICGRYEGIDERVRDIYVDREISIGDYVLSGGEYAAAVIVDSVSRFIPGFLG
ncbi:MAG: tRNA (guanosine(37)-N1)-methyltransferase TrmD, partial [Candidatus Dadabacteria bacterium]